MSEWVRLTDELRSCPPMYRYHHGDHDIGYQSAIGDTPEHFGWVRLTNEEAVALAHLLEARGWIDVKDRPPTPRDIYDERRNLVIVVDEEGNRCVSTARVLGCASGGYAWYPDSAGPGRHRNYLTVTHWLPLPKLPGDNDES